MHKRLIGRLIGLLLIIIIISCLSQNVLSFNHNANLKNQLILKNEIGEGKTCYGYQAYPNPDLIVSFNLDDPETLTTLNTPITSDKIAGGTWVNGVWWCCEYSSIDNSKIWTIYH